MHACPMHEPNRSRIHACMPDACEPNRAGVASFTARSQLGLDAHGGRGGHGAAGHRLLDRLLRRVRWPANLAFRPTGRASSLHVHRWGSQLQGVRDGIRRVLALLKLGARGHRVHAAIRRLGALPCRRLEAKEHFGTPDGLAQHCEYLRRASFETSRASARNPRVVAELAGAVAEDRVRRRPSRLCGLAGTVDLDHVQREHQHVAALDVTTLSAVAVGEL